MFDTETGFNPSLDENTWGISDISSDSSLNYTNSQDGLSLNSGFETQYIEENAIALENQRTYLDLLLDVDPGNSLNDAKDITLSNNPTTYSDWVGTTDPNDYYRFSLTQSSEFNLSLTGLSDGADVELLDSSGNTLLYSSNFWLSDESINAQLLAGDYYIRVHPAYSNDNTEYDLTVAATAVNDAGNSLNDALDINLTNSPTTYSDWVGTTDPNDYYRFSLAQSSEFDLSLTGLSDSADVELLDSSGNTLLYSSNFWLSDESINAQLLAGDYYIRVHPAYSNDNTEYDLTVSATAVNDAGNSLNNAKDITLNDTPTTYSDWVGTTDPHDYYRFSLTQSSEFDLSLTGLSDGANVELLDSSGDRLLYSNNILNNDESINAQLLAGDYYIRVYTVYSNDNTDYDLTVSATAVNDAGNSLNDAKDIILTEESTTYTDWVGATDTNDYYRFSISENKNLSLTLTGLDDDADVQLLDSTGALVAESGEFDTTSENLQAQLLAGTYYIRVYPSYSNDNTSYSLTLSAATIPVVPGYSIVDGFGLVNAAAAVAQAIGQNPFTDVPDLGGNDWGADLIDAPETWAAGYTGEGVVVAVLDTGVDYNHEDLRENIFTNDGEIAGDGIDNDNNGFIDDFYGWNFDSNNNNTLDGHSHGTHVAGTIASLNNDFGVTGIAHNAQIMPVKVLSDSGSGSEESVAAGIRYAADNGADVINMSLGGEIDDPSMRSAVEYAASKGVIVVMASGNDGDSTTMGHFPAAYATDWGIAVGAVDRNSNVASFTNRSGIFPLTYVTAPGAGVYSTTPNNGYGSKSGTSMATPHVAGVVALMLSANPDLTESEVYDIITSTAQSDFADSNSLSLQNLASVGANSLTLSQNSLVNQILLEDNELLDNSLTNFRLIRNQESETEDNLLANLNQSQTKATEPNFLLTQSVPTNQIIQPAYYSYSYDQLNGLIGSEALITSDGINTLLAT